MQQHAAMHSCRLAEHPRQGHSGRGLTTAACDCAAGVLLNTVLPDWLITFLLTALLLLMTYRTFTKSLSLHQASRHQS